MVAAKQRNGADALAAYRLRIDAVRPEAGLMSAVTSFCAGLEAMHGNAVDLARLHGIVVDLDRAGQGALCVTLDDALRRHTPPKAFSVAVGTAAERDMAGGTDARMSVHVGQALYLWLPEVNEAMDGGGSRLLDALRVHLEPKSGVDVFLDFGVEDEQDGFVRIFWPGLRRRGLTLSENGRYAVGRWGSGGRDVGRRELAFVHL